jgi:hypothetical protein
MAHVSTKEEPSEQPLTWYYDLRSITLGLALVIAISVTFGLIGLLLDGRPGFPPGRLNLAWWLYLASGNLLLISLCFHLLWKGRPLWQALLGSGIPCAALWAFVLFLLQR